MADSDGDLIHKVKVINNKTYIELKGKLLFTSTSSGYDNWRIAELPIITKPAGKVIEKVKEQYLYPSSNSCYGVHIEAAGVNISMFVYGSFTINSDYHLQLVVY